MSIEIVKQFYAATDAGDIPTALGLVSDDCQFDHTGPEGPPVNRMYVGREEIGEFFQTLGETQDTLEFDIKQYFAEGDQVVVVGSMRLQVKETGKAWGSDFAISHTVQDGRITRWRPIFDMTAEAEAYRR
jgi:ketosteroid isomerase-like protein